MIFLGFDIAILWACHGVFLRFAFFFFPIAGFDFCLCTLWLYVEALGLYITHWTRQGPAFKICCFFLEHVFTSPGYQTPMHFQDSHPPFFLWYSTYLSVPILDVQVRKNQAATALISTESMRYKRRDRPKKKRKEKKQTSSIVITLYFPSPSYMYTGKEGEVNSRILYLN